MHKPVHELRCGDMIWYEGEPAEVERVRGRNFISNAEGYTEDVPERDDLRTGTAEVVFKQWDGYKWQTEAMTCWGGCTVLACKHVIIPAGKHKVRDVDTGEEYEAELPYTVGYQWEGVE